MTSKQPSTPGRRRWAREETGTPDEGGAPRRFRRFATAIPAVIVGLAAVVLVSAIARLQPADHGDETGTPAKVRTLFGASVHKDKGQTYSQAVAASVKRYGRLGVIRKYYQGVPPSWDVITRDIGDLTPAVSFKAQPDEILTGAKDQEFSAWFKSAPRDRTVYWTYFHEPEDNVEHGQFTAAQFRKAFVHLSELADQADNPRLEATLTLMSYSLRSSHRDWKDYFPGREHVDVLAWDRYNNSARKGTYASPRSLFGPSVEAARSVDLPVAFGEFGSRLVKGDDGSGRAAWLDEVARYLYDNHTVFAAYFDSTNGGDYRLTDKPSQRIWRTVVGNRAPWQQVPCVTPPTPSGPTDPSGDPSGGPSGTPSTEPSGSPSATPAGSSDRPAVPSEGPSGIPSGPPSGVPSCPPSGGTSDGPSSSTSDPPPTPSTEPS